MNEYNLLLSLVIVLVTVQTAFARGSRGSGSKSTSEKNTNSGSEFGLKPITPTSFFSKVILAQTIRGSRSQTTKSTIERRDEFALLDAPVYSYGYSFHGGFLVIPDSRALRIRKQTELVTDSKGNECFQRNLTTVNLNSSIDDLLVRAVSIVHYSESLEFGNETYTSEIELKLEAFGRNVSVNCTAWYNQTLIQGKNCFRIQTTVEGALVQIVVREDRVPVLQLWHQVLIVISIIVLFPGFAFLLQQLFK